MKLDFFNFIILQFFLSIRFDPCYFNKLKKKINKLFFRYSQTLKKKFQLIFHNTIKHKK